MSSNRRWNVALLALSLVFVLHPLVSPLPALSVQAATAVTTGLSAIPDHITLTWTQDPKTTQTITWRTDLNVSGSSLQYAKQAKQTDFPANAQSVSGTTVAFDTNTGTFNIHSATVTGLEPGTVYVYHVGDGTKWSGIHTFTTEAATTNAFKFLIFGDSHVNSQYDLWQTCVQGAFKANPDASFIVSMGDMVDVGQDYNHWENWFAAAKGVIDTIPEMAVEGNHETFIPTDNTTGKPIYWKTQFNLPSNGPSDLIGQTYSYDYGNVHFVVLDSQQYEEPPSAHGDILAAQAAWLKSDLASTNKTWKIALFHKTPYYNKATRSNEYIKATFAPIFDQYHVDVVFNGHDHGVARTYPIYNDQFVENISKGTVYYVTGRSGSKIYPDLARKIWNAFFYDPQDQPGYITASVNGNILTLDATKANGTIIDHYVMNKDADTKLATPTFRNARIVVWGNMLQEPYLKTGPKWIDGKWYIPLHPFVQFIGGKLTQHSDSDTVTIENGANAITVSANGASASVNGKAVGLADKLLVNDGQYLVSADSVKVLLGFAWKYDKTSNILYFAK